MRSKPKIIKHIPERDQKRLEKLFNEKGAKIETYDEHWVHGSDDEGLSYCYECASKEVEKLMKENPRGDYCVDGGWRSPSDTLPSCETCGKHLDASLTDYGCEQEVDNFLNYEFRLNSNYGCYAMAEVINARGWGGEDDINENEYFENLHAVCWKILKKSGKNAKSSRRHRRRHKQP